MLKWFKQFRQFAIIAPKFINFAYNSTSLKAMADKRPPVNDDDDSDEEDNVKESKVVEPEVVEDATLANPDVVTKYQEAAKIVQAALAEVTAKVLH